MIDSDSDSGLNGIESVESSTSLRLGQVRLLYVNFNDICITNEQHICNQHLK